MKHDHVLKIHKFDLLTPSQKQGVGVCMQNICFHYAAFRDSLQLNMQHDHVMKNLNFDLLTPSLGSGLGSNICYHVAAFVVLQHDHVLKKFNFDLLTPFPGEV